MFTHTFVICAYNKSTYLRECIKSLENQTMPSSIICSTSTPNDYIKDICREHGILLCINPQQKGMAADWNYAYLLASTDYVTLVHQDDIYEPHFIEETIKYINKAKRPLIAFTDYFEIRNGRKIMSNKLLRIKRTMSIPWRLRVIGGSRFVARRIFMFGNPICCPSVTFVRSNLLNMRLFDTDYKNSCDWLAWLNIRNLNGDFVYIPKKLMGHRIHDRSETTNRIVDNTRNDEDWRILGMLSPQSISKLIYYFYKKSQKSNKV